jgi:hypothetical protein
MQNLPKTVGVVNPTSISNSNELPLIRCKNPKGLPVKIVEASIPATKAVPQLPVSDGAMKVFYGLHSFSNRNGLCWMSKRSLCERSRVTMHHINRYLHELIEWGLIESIGEKTFALKTMISIRKEVIQDRWNDTKTMEEKQVGLGDVSKSGTMPQKPQTMFQKHTKVKEKVFEGEEEKVKVNSPPLNASLESHFKAISERQRPIFLDQVRKAAMGLKKRFKDDSGWLDEGQRKKFVMIRNFHKKAEANLCGISFSDWT